MHRVHIGGIFSFIIFVVIFSGSVFAQGKVTIALGVNENYYSETEMSSEYIDLMKNFFEEAKIPYEIVYSDIEIAPDEPTRAQRGKKAAQQVRQTQPDVIISMGDNVLRQMLLNIDDIPIVGAFFFTSPEALGFPKANATGVTRRSYAEDIWNMAKQLTGAKTIGMLSRDSFAMQGVKKGLMARADTLEQATGVKLTDMYMCETFEDWKKHVLNWKEDLIYIIDTSRLTEGEKTYTSEETVKWTTENSKVPLIAVNEIDTEAGAMFSIVVSNAQWVYQAGQMAVKILSGTPVSEIPMEAVTKGDLLINAKTVQRYNIEMPYEILDTAAKIYE